MGIKRVLTWLIFGIAATSSAQTASTTPTTSEKAYLEWLKQREEQNKAATEENARRQAAQARQEEREAELARLEELSRRQLNELYQRQLKALEDAQKEREAKRQAEDAEIKSTFDTILKARREAGVLLERSRGPHKISGQVFIQVDEGLVLKHVGKQVYIVQEVPWVLQYMELRVKHPGCNKFLPAELASAISDGLRTVQTDSDGDFVFSKLPAGKYVVFADMFFGGSNPTGVSLYKRVLVGDDDQRVILTK